MSGSYSMAVNADTAQDAADIVKRRAREDGCRVLTVRKVHQQGDSRWFVELAITRKGPLP